MRRRPWRSVSSRQPCRPDSARGLGRRSRAVSSKRTVRCVKVPSMRGQKLLRRKRAIRSQKVCTNICKMIKRVRLGSIMRQVACTKRTQTSRSARAARIATQRSRSRSRCNQWRSLVHSSFGHRRARSRVRSCFGHRRGRTMIRPANSSSAGPQACGSWLYANENVA